MATWPQSFPKDCPPAESQEPEGRVYRLVSANPPGKKDFLSYHELDPVKWEGNCRACGLSVFRDISDAKRLLRRVRAMEKMKEFEFIASGSLEKSDGKLMYTPPVQQNSHHTWWIPLGWNRHNAFSVVE